MRRICLALPLIFAVFMYGAGTAAAVRTTWTYKGAGYTLTLTFGHVWFGYTDHGTLAYHNHRYHVEGDHVPAGDAGGELLRFYGHPFGNVSPLGLISVATLYNTCEPSCASGRTYALTTVMDWRLPGSTVRSVRLVVH